MADPHSSNESTSVTIEHTPASEHKRDAKSAPSRRKPPIEKQSKRPILWVMCIINLLLLLLLAGAGYYGWYVWQSQQQSVTNNYQALETNLTSKIDSLSSSLSNGQQQLEKLSVSVESTLAENSQLLIQNNEESTAQYRAFQARLNELSGRRPADWLLAEADFLVKMAGKKLWLEADIKSALLLLQNADARLQDLSDPSLLPIRKLLAEDIQTLKQLNPTRGADIALTVSSLMPSVDSLTVNSLQLPEAISDEQGNTKLSSKTSDWRSNLAKTWRSIVDDFISVKRRNAPIEPFMTEREQWLVKEQIKHSLTLAQSAANAQNGALYQQALQQIKTNIENNFDNTDSLVNQFSRSIAELEVQDLSMNYPDQLNSQQALTDVIDERMQSIFRHQADTL